MLYFCYTFSMQIKDVEKLAELARIEISSEEKKNLAKDLESILGYIKQIESVDVVEMTEEHKQRNIMREDRDSHQSFVYTEKLIDEVSDKKDNYVKVQKIL